MLHNDTETFEQLILRTSEYLDIKLEIIEKDYFVTVFLGKLVSKVPEIVFKGGTSLSNFVMNQALSGLVFLPSSSIERGDI